MHFSHSLSKCKNSVLHAYYFRKLQKKKRHAKTMKVGFIVQMPELWDYQIDVFRELQSRGRCEQILIVVPPFDQVKGRVLPDYKNNYFLSRYPQAERAVREDGSVLDVKKLHLDYVFYQRPYDAYLPKELRSYELMKYTRCCYIPYGYSGSTVFDSFNSNPQFFSNIFFVFSESERAKSLLVQQYRKSVLKQLQHFEFLGYPGFDPYYRLGSNHPGNTIKRILWTPRWTSSKAYGSSHFLGKH